MSEAMQSTEAQNNSTNAADHMEAREDVYSVKVATNESTPLTTGSHTVTVKFHGTTDFKTLRAATAALEAFEADRVNVREGDSIVSATFVDDEI